jgi:hypothetical protein
VSREPRFFLDDIVGRGERIARFIEGHDSRSLSLPDEYVRLSAE